MQLRNKKSSCLLALAFSVVSTVANADSLNGSGTWQTWNPSNLAADSSSPNLGTPYWNNYSGDGPKDNVGWCLNGGGSCSIPAGTQGALPYYGNGSGSVSTMYFSSSGSPFTVSLQTIMTTQTNTTLGYDILGYYVASGTGKAPSTPVLNPLFDSRTSAMGSQVTVSGLTAGENYGFYIENIQGGGTPYQANYIYFMDSTSNSSTGAMLADNLQHFAAFDATGGNYFVGDANADACQNGFQPVTSPCVVSSQFDYQDMLLEVKTTAGANNPEPASLGLLGGGLLLLGGWIRRHRVTRD